MTSRERVRRCLEFAKPDRVPRDLWMLPAAAARYGEAFAAFCRRWPVDVAQCGVGRCRPRRAQGDPYQPGTATDDWGCVFVNLIPGVHGEVKEPILADWADLERILPPEELLTVDRDAVNAWCRGTEKFVFGSGWARLFERMQFLRGSENLLMDIAEESAEFFALRDLVHGFYRRQYEVWAQTEVDALVLMDDWGAQRSLLISPAQWRRLFKPCYAEYVRIAHDAGKKFFMHSDGYIFDIYEDLIDIGVDAINSQLFCMDIAEIGRRFGGRITFWGEIDRQHVLPHGTVAETRAAVRRVIDHLYRPEGGVMAQFSFEGDTQMANAEAVFETWATLGR